MRGVSLKGVFYNKNGAIWVADETRGPLQLDDALRPLRNHLVDLTLQHLPQGTQSPCCFPDGKGCPLSHDLFPNRFLALALQGRLMLSPWKIRIPDAGDVILPLSALPGHYGALRCVTQIALESPKPRPLQEEARASSLLSQLRGPTS